MAAKRPPSPGLIPNPFIKKRNLEWSLEVPPQQTQPDERDTEEEQAKEARSSSSDQHAPAASSPRPDGLSAALESGAAAHRDPAAHFFARLAASAMDPYPPRAPRVSAAEFRGLFEENVGRGEGAHFVVHQHDHPVAGTHYDLRMQVNGTSSVSWAVMYGLPGDANSRRLNRNATETRVHCLWNHVVETASKATGSLVVWDCGRYEVLGVPRGRGPEVDPDSGGERDEEEGGGGGTEQEKLARAFAFEERKIRVRLHGRRLPEGYVLNLRLTKGEDAEGRRKSKRAMERPARRRSRRLGGGKKEAVPETSSEGEASEDEGDVVPDPLSQPAGEEEGKGLTEVDREIRELEDDHVRRTNAYAGAENSVGSVYQRRWYLSLDREASGFARAVVRGKKRWVLRDGGRGGDGEEVDEGGRLRFPFYVRGPEVERSVVTGRLGAEVLRDEGVTGFVRRKGWRPVLN